ncbi:KICSTOR complex protein kaptin [Amphibalanus amphitrite]|uniref:KICSTOR complex protein kaptin n=1 Tax=Amphibalanus amphitrite TaxID=1232801 RepID=A0A6A4VBF6_AMPAM|nr:KICSTOR complex protein kaptin [Amphibalanus amphitrite]
MKYSWIGHSLFPNTSAGDQAAALVAELRNIGGECAGGRCTGLRAKNAVYSLEYVQDDRGFLHPTVNEIPFTYLPEGSEIISVDAFNKSENKEEMVVGLAIIKDVDRSDGKTSQYLNIYSDWEPEFGASLLETLAQNWRHVELEFIPYQLQHAVVEINGILDTCFLLSGSDKNIHLYVEDKPNQSFREEPLEPLFPEFADLPSIVMWTNFYKDIPGTRITALACECGYVRVSVVDLASLSVTFAWSATHDSPITSVRLFSLGTRLQTPGFVSAVLREPADAAGGGPESLHLLVTNALWPSVVYSGLPLAEGEPPPRRHTLAESDVSDVVTCSCVCDINMDGRNEIVLGTYGQELLVYSTQGDEWMQIWRFSFSQPLLAVTYVDLIGDGINELVVLTNHGLHVLQHDTREAAALCLQRRQKLSGLTDGELSRLLDAALRLASPEAETAASDTPAGGTADRSGDTATDKTGDPAGAADSQTGTVPSSPSAPDSGSSDSYPSSDDPVTPTFGPSIS